MKLIDFIKYLKNNETEKYLEKHFPGIDYYNAEVYLKDSINKDSEIMIFDDEKIDGLIEMEYENEKYYNLFALDYLVEIFDDYAKPSADDKEIAERIINYRINDA